MAEYSVEEREYTPKNFFAGEFPTVTETGVAKAKIAEHTPVVIGEDGKVEAATSTTVANVVGITAAAAEANEPVVYYLTGEFFADAVALGDITLDALKAAFRKISIFLK